MDSAVPKRVAAAKALGDGAPDGDRPGASGDRLGWATGVVAEDREISVLLVESHCDCVLSVPVLTRRHRPVHRTYKRAGPVVGVVNAQRSRTAAPASSGRGLSCQGERWFARDCVKGSRLAHRQGRRGHVRTPVTGGARRPARPLHGCGVGIVQRHGKWNNSRRFRLIVTAWCWCRGCYRTLLQIRGRGPARPGGTPGRVPPGLPVWQTGRGGSRPRTSCRRARVVVLLADIVAAAPRRCP